MRQWPYVYRLIIGAEDEEAEISIGDAPRWLKWNIGLLKRATYLALIADAPFFPSVKVNIPPGAQCLYFRRVFGCLSCGNVGEEKILHAIGWEYPATGQRMLLWIYPSGIIEVAEEPTMIE